MTGWAIDQLAAMDVAEPVVADLGAGSGAIALSIAQEVPRAQVHAVEADPLARQWTERNIASVAESSPHTAGRVALHAADFAAALAELDGQVDLVVSNPPYIPVGAWVPPEVGEYDPATALWGGADGMDCRPGGRGHGAPSAPAGRARRRRARRPARRGRVLGLCRGEWLAGDSQSCRPGGPGPVCHRSPAMTRLSAWQDDQL